MYRQLISFLTLLGSLQGTQVTKCSGQCGHPGLPVGSFIVTDVSDDDHIWKEGDVVRYQCREGWVKMVTDEDEDNGGSSGDILTIKKCLNDGTWTNSTIVCWENLAINQPSLQSGTFLDNYSHLAVDGDSETCSFTQPGLEQKWWQVQIRPSLVNSILIKIGHLSSLESVSVFIIELLPDSKAEYKECNPLNQNITGYKQFNCSDQKGEFVYIRDDKMTGEHLGICEVAVIPRHDPDRCGVPEGPLNGAVILSETHSRVGFQCEKGYTLVGEGEGECRGSEWVGINGSNLKTPSCVAMNCSIPESPENGRVQVLTGTRSFKFGATVFVLCDEGYVLSGNNTRRCMEGGKWTGPPPSCAPILCPNPPAVVNGLVELLNGTTLRQAVASYQCLPGFYNYGYENTSVVYSTCQLNGTWSQVSLTCMQLSGYPLDGDIPWHGKQEVSSSTIITITVLTTLIIAILAAVIVSIFIKRRKTSSENERKISTSSTNQLLYNQIDTSSDKSIENNNGCNYDKWKIAQDYSLLQKSPSNESSYLEDHIYSTLKKQNARANERRDSIDNEDDEVYATVNFRGNSIAVIANEHDDINEGQTHSIETLMQDDKISVPIVTNDISDLYAKIDVNKKKNRK